MKIKRNLKSKIPRYNFVPDKAFSSTGKKPVSYVKGMVDFSPRKQKTVSADCSCGGEFENCFRCSGTGVYDKIVAVDEDTSRKTISSTDTIAGFASDQRGGSFGIREKGRFGSNAEFDDFSDESVS